MQMIIRRGTRVHISTAASAASAGTPVSPSSAGTSAHGCRGSLGRHGSPGIIGCHGCLGIIDIHTCLWARTDSGRPERRRSPDGAPTYTYSRLYRQHRRARLTPSLDSQQTNPLPLSLFFPLPSYLPPFLVPPIPPPTPLDFIQLPTPPHPISMIPFPHTVSRCHGVHR